MEVKRIKSEELTHHFAVHVPAADVKLRLNSRIAEVAASANLPGFRPGKVPPQVIQTRYGKELLSEVLEQIVTDALKSTFEKENLRPVSQPKITESNINAEFDGEKDVEFKFEVAVAPEITEINYSDIEITVPEVDIGKDKIDEFLQQLAEQNRPTEAAPAGHKAAVGDIAVIDFEGFLDEVAFDGGKGEDFRLELGSGTFIPGFEEALVGVKTGDKTDVKVTFPEDYGSAELAGKPVRFAVEVKSIDRFQDPKVDDKLAEAMGLENLKALQDKAQEVLSKNFTERGDEIKKVYLLNELDNRYDFPLPQVLVDGEFDHLWQSVQHAKEHGHLEEEDKGKSDAELKETYMAIARRRIKLALLVETIADKNKFEVSDNDLSTEGLRRMQQMPPHMQQAYMQQIQQNPRMLEELRMPLLENKVVEHILGQAKVTTDKVSEEQFEEIEKTAFSGEQLKKSSAKKAKAKVKAKSKAKSKTTPKGKDKDDG